MKRVKIFHPDEMPPEFIHTMNEYLWDRFRTGENAALPWTVGEGTKAYVEMSRIKFPADAQDPNEDGYWDGYGGYPELDDWFMTQGIKAGETVFIAYRENDLWWRLP